LDPGSGNNAQAPYMEGYSSAVAYILETYLHSPLSQILGAKNAKVVQSTLGAQAAGALSPYYAINYYGSNAVHDGSRTVCGGNVGPATNGTDASDFALFADNTTVQAGGRLHNGNTPNWMNGDTIKDISGAFYCGSAPGFDELQPGTQWFSVTNVDNSTLTFQVICPIGHAVTATCPTPGQPFTGFSIGGVVQSPGYANGAVITRHQYDPGGFIDENYQQDMGSALAYLNILGYNVSNAQANFDARNGSGGYNDNRPGYHLDPTVAVPR